MNEANDETDFIHEHIHAFDAASLHAKIQKKEKEGFELVTVVSADGEWHAFMKCSLIQQWHKIVYELEVLNTGIGSIINNESNFATSGEVEELKSVLYSILHVLENR